jgi:DNA repair photolyase
MARENLVRVQLSVATLDREIARTLEPRASTPARRIEALRTLAQAGVPTGVIVAPLIPALTDTTLEAVLEAAATAGVRHAAFTVLRLPLEVSDLFKEWLREFAPLRAERVMSLVRQMRGGADYQSDFSTRMSGTGIYARLLRQRFDLACRRLGLDHERETLDATRFRVPQAASAQGSLF